MVHHAHPSIHPSIHLSIGQRAPATYTRHPFRPVQMDRRWSEQPVRCHRRVAEKSTPPVSFSHSIGMFSSIQADGELAKLYRDRPSIQFPALISIEEPIGDFREARLHTQPS